MKSLVTQAAIAVLVCIGTIGAYAFWYSAIETKSASVASLQSEIDTKRVNAGRIASARVALAEISGDEMAVHSYFVPETGVVAFIDDIEARGRAQKAAVSVLSVSRDDAGARPVLTLTISIKGTFDAVMRTIGSIEYAPYDLSLSSLSLGQDDKNLWHADSKILVGSVSTGSPQATP